MTLLDTNVVIDAYLPESPFHHWARQQIAFAVSGDGAGLNPVSLAELVVGRSDFSALYSELQAAGISLLDLPFEASAACGIAYGRYRRARQESGGGAAPVTPLPDFFIGAHAEVMGWPLVTRDARRIKTYFPAVAVIEPAG